MKIKESDLIFFINKTKLPLRRLLLLLEEERDYNLVISSIAERMTMEEILNLNGLSNQLKIKLTIYHITTSNNYDIEEKSYISEILIDNYKQIYKTGFLLKKGQNKLINDFISVINSENKNTLIMGKLIDKFHKIGRSDVGKHVSEWIDIIVKSKELIND